MTTTDDSVERRLKRGNDTTQPEQNPETKRLNDKKNEQRFEDEKQRMFNNVMALLLLGFLFPPLWGMSFYVSKNSGGQAKLLGRISLSLLIAACFLVLMILYIVSSIKQKSEHLDALR
ncbi:hypothetical protein AKO1_005441 [Acrasis kona]|uniref:Uncharacterized protein n=1 Tax=Acrasis kona TaxID=1008807 RepID=A0AAW2ZKI3_9EUKA